MRQAISHRLLRGMIGETLANAVTTGAGDGAGAGTGHDHLASLDLLVGLDQLAAGTLDRQAFARSFGRRGPHEYELSRPRPGEDPDWVDQQLGRSTPVRSPCMAAPAPDRSGVGRRGARSSDAGGRSPSRPGCSPGRGRTPARRRESLRSASVRGLGVVRTFVQRAGDLTDDDGDVLGGQPPCGREG